MRRAAWLGFSKLDESAEFEEERQRIEQHIGDDQFTERDKHEDRIAECRNDDRVARCAAGIEFG